MNLAPHHVKREEIIDYQTYSETRDEIRKEVMRIKAPRRIHLGQYLTFLFENHETIKYQIQEITRTEKGSKIKYRKTKGVPESKGIDNYLKIIADESKVYLEDQSKEDEE